MCIYIHMYGYSIKAVIRPRIYASCCSRRQGPVRSVRRPRGVKF